MWANSSFNCSIQTNISWVHVRSLQSKLALTFQWDVDGDVWMKGTNTGDQTQHGDRSRTPHGFLVVNLGRPEETSALLSTSSVHLSGALEMVYLRKAAQTEEAPWIHPRARQTERRTQNTTNPPWLGVWLLPAQPGITRHATRFHLHQQGLCTALVQILLWQRNIHIKASYHPPPTHGTKIVLQFDVFGSAQQKV